MARLVAVAVFMSDEARLGLEALDRAHSTPQQLALRARIILQAADGVGVHETARRLSVWPKTVRRWRRRWNDTTATADLSIRLADAPRPGVRPKFTAEQICAIIALSCKRPEAEGVPITHWSQSELARQAVHRGIVDKISHGSVGRFLKGGRHSTALGAALVDGEVGSRLREEVW